MFYLSYLQKKIQHDSFRAMDAEQKNKLEFLVYSSVLTKTLEICECTVE